MHDLALVPSTINRHDHDHDHDHDIHMNRHRRKSIVFISGGGKDTISIHSSHFRLLYVCCTLYLTAALLTTTVPYSE